MNTYKVKLKVFQDNATDEWGLAHSNSLDLSNGDSFNAFWTGEGIFHDVFEHYFEDKHKYFKDKYAFNIGGEVAAMGHLAYYYSVLRIDNRMQRRNNFYAPETSLAQTTSHIMQESIQCGYFTFGNKLMCGVPKQKDVNSYFLSNVINEHLYYIEEKCFVAKDCEPEYKEMCRAYRRSITENRLTNLYTWGYKQAEMIAPYNDENKETLEGFINYWVKFCSNNSAEEMANLIDEIEFTITTGENLKWEAELITHENTRIDVKSIHSIYDIHEYYLEEIEN
jgi:hypothetical protein